jgi:hypothetical protein
MRIDGGFRRIKVKTFITLTLILLACIYWTTAILIILKVYQLVCKLIDEKLIPWAYKKLDLTNENSNLH